MATRPGYRAQRVLRADAFAGKALTSEDNLQRELTFYNHGHNGPIYRAPADLCVMAPDGRFVAGCETLIDARNREADIERICTHSAYRRRGLARAVIIECLHRLQAMGVQRAYITGYSAEALALYGSMGHVGDSRAFVYEKPPHSHRRDRDIKESPGLDPERRFGRESLYAVTAA